MLLRRSTQRTQRKNEEFWERERRANSTRKKDIEHLSYLVIPNDLPSLESSPALKDILANNSTLSRDYERITTLRDKKILNLTGKSNTDLKLEYGVANLTVLTEYDDNYTLLSRSLARLGHGLMEQGDYEDAIQFLEYDIKTGTDIRSVYEDLCDYYVNNNKSHKISWLRQYAEILISINKPLILELLDKKEEIDSP